MSNRVTQLCRPIAVSAAQKSVLMCLADRSDDGGAAWPSIPGICEWTCLKRTAVIEALKALEAAGFVSVVKECGKNNRCQMNLEAIGQIKAVPMEAPNQSGKRTGPPDGPVRQTDATSPADGPPPVRQADYTRPAGGPEASISINQASESIKGAPASSSEALAEIASLEGRTESQHKRPESAEAGADIPAWMPEQAWRDFAEMRTKLRRPLTPKAVALSVRHLDRFRAEGHDISEILERSVMNGWTGLFAPRAATSGRARTGGTHAGFADKNYRQGANADGSF